MIFHTEVIRPSVEDSVQPPSKVSSWITPSGKTAASARKDVARHIFMG